MMSIYRIKTTSGYADLPRKRHGSFNATQIEATFFCKSHAEEQVKLFSEYAPELEPEVEEVNGSTPCPLCKQEGAR
jgi:hypothetical protein